MNVPEATEQDGRRCLHETVDVVIDREDATDGFEHSVCTECHATFTDGDPDVDELHPSVIPVDQNGKGLVNIDVVARRVSAASPGPWDVEPHDHMLAGCRCMSCYAIVGFRIDHPKMLDCEDTAALIGDDVADSRLGDWPPAETCAEYVMSYADAEFAAQARTDVPALVDENLRMRELLAYLQLHIGRYEWTQLTTEQKELLADVVEDRRRRMQAEDGLDYTSTPVDRWWRT